MPCRERRQGRVARVAKRPREGKVGDLNQRIEAMHRRDVRVAWAFVIGLWFAVIFVAIATWDLAPTGGARTLLLIGGAIAAPLAALAAKRLPHRPFMLLVGLLIVLLNVRTLILTL